MAEFDERPDDERHQLGKLYKLHSHFEGALESAIKLTRRNSLGRLEYAQHLYVTLNQSITSLGKRNENNTYEMQLDLRNVPSFLINEAISRFVPHVTSILFDSKC